MRMLDDAPDAPAGPAPLAESDSGARLPRTGFGGATVPGPRRRGDRLFTARHLGSTEWRVGGTIDARPGAPARTRASRSGGPRAGSAIPHRRLPGAKEDIMRTFIRTTILLASAALLGGAGPASLDDAMWFSFITITTTGYGDILPVSDLARSLSALESVVGVLYPAILISRLVSLAQGPSDAGEKDP